MLAPRRAAKALSGSLRPMLCWDLFTPDKQLTDLFGIDGDGDASPRAAPDAPRRHALRPESQGRNGRRVKQAVFIFESSSRPGAPMKLGRAQPAR